MSGGSGSGSGSGSGGRRGRGSGSGSGSGSGGGGGGLAPLTLGPDGVVRGGNGSDNIFPGFTDGDGDRVDSNDARLPGEAGNDDIIYANGGNDTVNASDGNDYVDAGAGNDVAYGGDGNDVVAGNEGNDTVYAGEGNDTVFGGGGSDRIFAGSGNDRIYGDTQTGNTGNLITNGDFSSSSGWHRVDENNDGVAPFVGGGRAQFNQGGRAPGDAIQQTFATNIGAEHTVSLDLFEDHSGVAHHGFRIDVLDADGNVISSESVAVQDGTTEHVSFTFTATTPNTTLRITNTTATGNSNGSDGKIDNVSVIETPSVAGNDTIDAGEGHDYVDGGDGNDSLLGGDGNDTVNGGVGNDTVDGGIGHDQIDGGAGNDSLYGHWGGDNIQGGSGNDTVDGGFSTDHMDGGDGIDTVSFQRAFGSADQNVDLDLQAGTARLSDGTTETATNFENAIGSAGDDTLAGTDGTNVIQGADGDDVIDGRGGDDILIGGDGKDVVSGGDGRDYLEGGDGSDTLYGGAANDTLDGGDGDDTLFGNEGYDTFVSSDGSDSIVGGLGRDTYKSADPADEHIDAFIDDGGNGHIDKLIEGSRDTVNQVEHFVADETANDDSITLTTNVTDVSTITGFDNSASGVFTPNNGAAINFGGPGQPTLRDILDGNVPNVSPGGTYRITDGDESGQVGNISFENFEEINFTVVCFARGTQIATSEGEVAIETLSVGDKVMTKDNGAQPIRWIGNRHISAEELEKHPNLKPVRISAGALGPDMPKRDLVVSPQHRIFVSSKIAERMFGKSEVLIAAKKLTMFKGIDVVEDNPDGVSYYHFLCENHELVWSEGTVTETLFTGTEALKSLSPEARDEIFAIFPELKTGGENGIPMIARATPKGAELRVFLERMQRNRKALVDPKVTTSADVQIRQ
ncbi:Hint domain-containing protein [Shimia sp.]|uniref:Hint domain-containing protein n=1 Tax=Shimia sp. TaxID=1954381 RepID=UPI003BABD06D